MKIEELEVKEMDDIKFNTLLYYAGEVLMPRKEEVFFYIRVEDFWLYQWKKRQYNNHNMALMLIDILYSRKMLNEATYRKIMQKHSYNQVCRAVRLKLHYDTSLVAKGREYVYR